MYVSVAGYFSPQHISLCNSLGVTSPHQGPPSMLEVLSKLKTNISNGWEPAFWEKSNAQKGFQPGKSQRMKLGMNLSLNKPGNEMYSSPLTHKHTHTFTHTS